MESNDLLDQWITFCKGATPGLRFWLDDDLFERLSCRLDKDLRYFYLRYFSEFPSHTFAITFRGGYEVGGLTFYRKSSFPHPPRRAPGRQEFYAR